MAVASVASFEVYAIAMLSAWRIYTLVHVFANTIEELVPLRTLAFVGTLRVDALPNSARVGGVTALIPVYTNFVDNVITGVTVARVTGLLVDAIAGKTRVS